MRPEKPKLAARHTRRDFLLKAANSLAKLAVANVGIYVVGSAFKSLDGSLVAGAKEQQCYYTQGSGFTPFCSSYTIGPFPDCAGHNPDPLVGTVPGFCIFDVCYPGYTIQNECAALNVPCECN